jgi:protein-S-isoprenylcysteine O-methyltransferase Ste14
VRHPLYTSAFCGAAGWSLIRHSWPALAGSLALTAFFDTKVRREECWLEEQFPEYADYARRVHRFIPWVY